MEYFWGALCHLSEDPSLQIISSRAEARRKGRFVRHVVRKRLVASLGLAWLGTTGRNMNSTISTEFFLRDRHMAENTVAERLGLGTRSAKHDKSHVSL
ncbi:uncharacterized protein N7525_009784 [Penicillium rubens]|jgi:hypothetical protein|uniref:uncharacterized protein n=1 Tax=Penicillium rubens TaxID=1108849 RepID=UPI002A5A3477|nr:uncharacterized protein N7525_009784 [Penicillium rubens]KAJ5831531.1 hypothetical protein N7525_009784 [Penicillium rubens]